MAYLHNHLDILKSIRAECAIIQPRAEDLDINAPDYEAQELMLLDDLIEVATKPFVAVVDFLKEYYPEEAQNGVEVIDAGLAIGEVFRILNEKRAIHRLLNEC